MKKNRKGFTIVELVIVIAVIAVLAAILIPTFTDIVKSANEAAAVADCRNAYAQYVVEVTDAGDVPAAQDEVYFTRGKITYVYEGGEITEADKIEPLDPPTGVTAPEGKTYQYVIHDTYGGVTLYCPGWAPTTTPTE